MIAAEVEGLVYAWLAAVGAGVVVLASFIVLGWLLLCLMRGLRWISRRVYGEWVSEEFIYDAVRSYRDRYPERAARVGAARERMYDAD